MFTGIIEGMGVIRQVRPGLGLRLRVQADFPLDGTRVGDSIAVSGACLTVVEVQGPFFSADVSPETVQRTTLGQARPGDRVNLERALAFSGRLDGHLVTGHVDGIGSIQDVRPEQNALILSIQAPEALLSTMVEKGSVAVDGVSLTINACDKKGFIVSIIPHTARVTTIGAKQAKDPVNLETDIIGKYVERFVQRALAAHEGKGAEKRRALDMEFLAKSGFL